MTTSLEKFRRQTARRLRANATGAEARLWRMLRGLPVFGTHFRRQVPIGPFVADFACMSARLAIELDGSQHARTENIERDRIRTEWLEREGYRVIRFWNSDVTGNPGAVLAAIYAELYGSLAQDAKPMKHIRRRKTAPPIHPTPARVARRPSPSRGG
jgi:very-short-patch-repair endonuclease